MRRTFYIPIGIILLAVCIVTIARAQQWSAWTGLAGEQGQAATPGDNLRKLPPLHPQYPQQGIANELNRGRGQAAGTASRFAAPPSQAQQPNPFVKQSRLPPLTVENQFATDSNWGDPQPTVVQAQAIRPSASTDYAPTPRDARANAAQPFGSRPFGSRGESAEVRFANVGENAAAVTIANVRENAAQDGVVIAQRHRVAQATEEITTSNRGESIDDPPSSRRPSSLRGEMTPDSEESLRLARRDGAADTTTGHLGMINLPSTGKVLFHAEEPALSVTLAGPGKIGVGKTSEFAVAIKNSSRVEAEDVNVVLDLPGWAKVTSSEATLGAARHQSTVGDNHRIKWNIFQLEAGATEKLALKLVARESRSFELAVNWTHAPKMHLAQIEVQEAKLEMQLTGPRDVLYGETKTYTITVANPGTGPAENVVINLLPITPGQDKAGVSNLGTIEAGGRQEIEIDLTARQAGELELRAQAFADANLRAEAAEVIQVRRGALEAVVGGPEIKYAGTVAAYQLRVANTGDAMAESVLAEAILPRNANFVSASDGGELAETTGRVQWKVGALRPGATRVFELRCVLAEAGGNRLEVITSAEEDLTSAAHWVTQVEALADLKLLINDPQGPVPAGEPAMYEVRILNRGTKAAEGVQIATFFSEGIEPLSVEGGRAEIGVGQVVFHPIGRVVAGQEVVYRISARAETAGNHTFRTEVVCDSPETKLAAQETTRFYGNGGGAENYAPPTQPVEANLPPPGYGPSRFGERR